MTITEYKPSDKLASFVKVFRIIETQQDIINKVLPNTSFAVAIQLQGQVSYIIDGTKTLLPVATFSGLRKSVRHINYVTNSKSVIILFTETGIQAFSRKPLFELFEKSISLDNIFNHNETAILLDKLSNTGHNNSIISFIEEFLFSKLTITKTDELISAAIQQIYHHNGHLKISELANSLFISQDAFEKRFRKVTGASPKLFSNIIKMNAIVKKKPTQPLIDIAFENGFYDQSHFNRDFKLFTGDTPSVFFRSSAFW